MEEEARQILKIALAARAKPELNLAESIHRRFAPLGGLDLPEYPRSPMRPSPNFDEF
jgi:hypothetical protein